MLPIVSFTGLTSEALENAKIEKVSAADEWRVTLADGRNFFIQKVRNAALQDVLVVKGTNRTFDLAPESFSLAVAGRFVVDNPLNSSNDFQDPSKNWIIAFGAGVRIFPPLFVTATMSSMRMPNFPSI